MNRKFALLVILVLGIVGFILYSIRNTNNEADQIFASALAKGSDLNSGITIERSIPYAGQSNNITFAVFNHTDESIIFPNQGFGLTIFRYVEDKKAWEKLQIQHMPYPEMKEVPAKTETWNVAGNSTWTILEEETTTLGYKQIRVYVSGRGKTTNKTYGAYLDVNLTTSP